jgi:hypothetical protein
LHETTLTKRQQKRAVFEKLLNDGDAFLIFDPRRDGVQVPAHLRKQASLALQYGVNMVIPIRNFLISDLGVAGVLSFDRLPFECFVPWDAVFCITTGGDTGIGWTEDFPKELLTEVSKPAELKKQHHLRVVKNE